MTVAPNQIVLTAAELAAAVKASLSQYTLDDDARTRILTRAVAAINQTRLGDYEGMLRRHHETGEIAERIWYRDGFGDTYLAWRIIKDGNSDRVEFDDTFETGAWPIIHNGPGWQAVATEPQPEAVSN